MPLNEAAGFRTRSNLTPKQRQEQTAALYGLIPKHMSQNLTHAEIERMRAILLQHDGEQKRGGIKEFDLNKPPQQPYQYEEFPRVVYHAKHASRVAHNEEQLAEALEKGWSKTPVVAEEPAAVVLDAAALAEVAALDKEARKKRAA